MFKFTVWQELILRHLRKKNGKVYNMHKASEEFQELALVLNQKLLKPNKVDDQEIIDEIGDVLIRLAILMPLYNQKAIVERVKYKLNKYEEYKDSNKYKQI